MTVKEISSLYHKLYRPLCLYSFKYTKDYEASEDIVQDCFSAFLEKASDGRPRIGNARAYLYSAARNRCIDLLRARGTEVHLSPDFDTLDNEYAEDSFEEARVWERLEALPPRQRQILLMCKRDGMAYSEIADALGISIQTVKNQMSRALKSLRYSEKTDLLMVLFLMFPVI
ncbi:MAG: RNA polymerase sigma factor [Candidatus Cryptobacteroides sp.]